MANAFIIYYCYYCYYCCSEIIQKLCFFYFKDWFFCFRLENVVKMIIVAVSCYAIIILSYWLLFTNKLLKCTIEFVASNKSVSVIYFNYFTLWNNLYYYKSSSSLRYTEIVDSRLAFLHKRLTVKIRIMHNSIIFKI